MTVYMWNRCFVVVLVLLLGVALAVTGCSRPAPGEENKLPQEEETVNEPELEEETGFIAPLTGERLEAEILVQRRPLAVMIDNDPTFGAQSGLDKAAWVYEMPVEGGITRFLAIFQHRDAPVLGPVRSTRHYFLDRVLEFEAALGHVGYSPQAKEDIPRLGIISLNEFTLPHLYWRVKDKKMPHNLYTDTQRLFAEIDRRGLNKYTPKWDIRFLTAEDEVPGDPVTRIRIHYPLGVVEYRYSPSDGTYRRLFRGKPHKDAETGEQLLVTNIIIQYVPRPRVLDSEGRLDLQTVGSGKAKIFQLGKGYEATWEKKSRQDWTRFANLAGNSILLAPGNTWVQVVPEGTRVEIE